jgi:hypothetical protein
VRANLVYRNFARIGGGKMPDAKTMGRWGVAVASLSVFEFRARTRVRGELCRFRSWPRLRANSMP